MAVDIYINAQGDFNKRATRLMDQLSASKLRRIMKTGAKTFIAAAKTNAPIGPAVANRYSGGQIVARYFKGNLKRSLKVLTKLRKIKRGVVVGPAASAAKGDFKGRKVDGFYAPFVEFGTINQSAQPFIGPAWRGSKARVLANIIRQLKQSV